MSRKVQGAIVREAKSSRYGKQRLDPDHREQLILEGAIAYFAEHGFEGRTRGLAKHLGISQSLLYRYFPSMSALVDRVYDSIYVGRWKAEWQEIIADRSRSLDDRLREFYNSYYLSINRYETMRVTMFSALGGEKVATRYVERVKNKIIRSIVAEVRHTYGMIDVDKLPIHSLEEELVFSLHASVIYSCIREYVFDLATENQYGLLIELNVDSFVNSAEENFKRVHVSIAKSSA